MTQVTEETVKQLFGNRHVNFKLRVYRELEKEYLTSARITQKVNVGKCYRDCLVKKAVDSYLRVWASTQYVEKSTTTVRHPIGVSTYQAYKVRTYRRTKET